MTSVSVAAGAAAGGASAGEMQALVVLAGASCADQGAKQLAGSNERVLNPLEGLIGSPATTAVLGAIAGPAGLACIHGAVVLALSKARWRGYESWRETAAAVRFPALPLMAAGFVHQGLALESMRLLIASNSSRVALANISSAERAPPVAKHHARMSSSVPPSSVRARSPA